MGTALRVQDAEDAFARRRAATRALGEDADLIAAACRDMATRFHRGGRLISFGNGAATADAAHLAVEFVHPVVVGKRALPAISLVTDPATLTGIARRSGFDETFAAQLRTHARPEDIAVGISVDGGCGNVARALVEAHERDLLTVALVGGEGGAVAAVPGLDHLLPARSSDPDVVKEIHVTTYHVLWELVHVFLERPGALGRRSAAELDPSAADRSAAELDPSAADRSAAELDPSAADRSAATLRHRPGTGPG